jgi:succinyl-CoA synthetase beta subunit
MTTLAEHDSKRLLAAHGVRIAPERVAHTVEEAVSAARDLGLPVVAKLAGDGIAHKTERGLVRLGLSSDEEVAAACDDLLAAATPDDGDVVVLVAPMVAGIRELIAGVHDDPQFGRCVMIGVGGVLAEALGDVTFRLVPIDALDAQEMLDDLSGQALLGPVRGEPPVDRVAVAEVLLALSRLAEAHPEVVAVDVNPLIVVDGRPIAVDALVEVR